MKATKRRGWAAVMMVVLGQIAAAREAPVEDRLPALEGAEVTIPYNELKLLWEAVRRGQETGRTAPEPKPPVTAVVRSADYELKLASAKATLEARFQVESLSGEWQTIPLLGGDARLDDSETGGAGLLFHDGSYCLLTEGTGLFEARLTLTAAPPDDWSDGFRLRPAFATRNRLQVTGTPVGKSVRIDGLEPTEAADGVVTFHLPGNPPELVVSLVRYEKPAAPPEPVPPTPSQWGLQSEVFVSYEEGRIHYDCAVYAQADDGSGLSMELLLPHNTLGLTVDGEDVKKSEFASRRNGMRPLRVEWATRDILDRKLLVSYQVPQSPLSSDWSLHAPRVAGQGETRSLFAVLAVDGLELRGDNLRDSVQSRRLPEWLRSRIGRREFLTAEAGHSLVLHTTWLPRVETAQAMVSKASYDSRIVPDGGLLVQAELVIQHQAPLAWRVILPDIEEILSCEINQAGAQPVRRGDNEIEFSLAQPSKGSSTVGFCFAARREPFDPVSGRLELSMPKTELFIHELEWTLTIPTDYEAEIQGNVQVDRLADGTTRPPNVIPLRKELVRDEHPAVEIHYRRRGLGD